MSFTGTATIARPVNQFRPVYAQLTSRASSCSSKHSTNEPFTPTCNERNKAWSVHNSSNEGGTSAVCVSNSAHKVHTGIQTALRNGRTKQVGEWMDGKRWNWRHKSRKFCSCHSASHPLALFLKSWCNGKPVGSPNLTWDLKLIWTLSAANTWYD